VLANTLLPEAVSPHERIPLRLEMIEAGILQSLEDVREQYEQVRTSIRQYIASHAYVFMVVISQDNYQRCVRVNSVSSHFCVVSSFV
jgi:hypothetical protein